MKRKVVPFLVAWIMLASILPIHASAFGGFVAVKGSKTFHSVYCDTLEGCKLNDLRWFDNSNEARKAGLSECDACSDYADWEYIPDSGYVPWFATDDPLLLSALELEYDIGSEDGYDTGYEYGFSDGKASGEVYYEYIEPERNDNYSDGYDVGFDEGYAKGKDRGYNEGYDDGYLEGRESEKVGMFEIILAAAISGAIGFYCGKTSKKIELDDEAKKAELSHDT